MYGAKRGCLEVLLMIISLKLRLWLWHSWQRSYFWWKRSIVQTPALWLACDLPGPAAPVQFSKIFYNKNFVLIDGQLIPGKSGQHRLSNVARTCPVLACGKLVLAKIYIKMVIDRLS